MELKNIQNLERIGLTKGEIKIYVALVKGGALTKTRLADASGVSSSKIYEVAGKLLKKGLISSYTKNKVLYYNANNPSFLKKYIDEKEKALAEEKRIVDDLMPDLEKMKSENKEDTGFELYEGYEGLKNVFTGLFENLPENSTLCGFGVELKNLGLLHKYHRMRIEKGIKQKMIFSDRNMERTGYKNNEIRFIPGITDVGLGITDREVIIQTFGEKPLTLIIKHPDVARSFKQVHSALWDVAKE